MNVYDTEVTGKDVIKVIKLTLVFIPLLTVGLIIEDFFQWMDGVISILIKPSIMTLPVSIRFITLLITLASSFVGYCIAFEKFLAWQEERAEKIRAWEKNLSRWIEN